MADAHDEEMDSSDMPSVSTATASSSGGGVKYLAVMWQPQLNVAASEAASLPATAAGEPVRASVLPALAGGCRTTAVSPSTSVTPRTNASPNIMPGSLKPVCVGAPGKNVCAGGHDLMTSTAFRTRDITKLCWYWACLIRPSA